MLLLWPLQQRSLTSSHADMDNPKPPKIPRTQAEKDTAPRLFVVLENAPLETVKVGGEFRLLNSDDHSHIILKHKRDPADSRCVSVDGMLRC